MINKVTPLLTVVIPTRNRFDYVKSAIKSVLRITSPLLQLAVEDNSDSIELGLWLKDNISDSRLVYHHSNDAVSMSENYDRAMNLATGEYVCLIGDDDGVSLEIILAAQWAKENGYDALVPNSLVNYVWPDLQMSSYGAMSAGELVVRPFTGELSFPDGQSEMKKCAESAGQSFHKLPKAYYGIVQKTRLEQVKQKTGTFFPGISPDMSAALAIANFAKRICYIDYPLFVPGSSAKSNAGLSGMKKHIGWLRDQPHLPANCEENWSEIVPVFYSVETIWAEATVNALKMTGRNDILKYFNVPWLYAYCSIFHKRYMHNTVNLFFRALQATQRGKLLGIVQFSYWFFYWWGLRVKSFVNRLFKTSYRKESYCIQGVETIDGAVLAVSNYLEKNGHSFLKTVNAPNADTTLA